MYIQVIQRCKLPLFFNRKLASISKVKKNIEIKILSGYAKVRCFIHLSKDIQHKCQPQAC